MSVHQGRQNFRDPYSGGQFDITIQNNDNYAASIIYGDRLTVEIPGTTYSQWPTVRGITYQDAMGDKGVNMATITCQDNLGSVGRALAQNLVLTQTTPGLQLAQFPASVNLVQFAVAPWSSNGSSIAAATTYTGSYLNYLNLLTTTERGCLTTYQQYIYFASRTSQSLTTAFDFGPTSTANRITYQSFNRLAANSLFVNTFTVSATGIADQTAVNTTSSTAYGAALDSSQTVDATAAQALSNASWMANTFSDPASLRYVVQFLDLPQTDATTNNAMVALQDARPFNLTYKNPGGADVTVAVKPEGYEISATPESSIITAYLSPLTYYQQFILNSSTYGILNTSRLGW